MTEIVAVHGREILDSRGNPTVEVEIATVSGSEGRALDMAMIEADGTRNRERLGANAILGVSLAAAKAAAESAGLPLFRYLGGPGAYTLPVPCANILNGGAHAANNVDFQEFMVVPVGFEGFDEALLCVAGVYQTLKKLLSEKKLGGGIGDEGGFAPDLDDNGEALALMSQAVERSGYTMGDQVGFAL